MGEQEIILVGVDGSKESLNAVKWAINRVKITGARMHILCAYSLPSFTPSSLEGGYATIDDTAIKEGAKVVVDQAMKMVAEEEIEATSSVEIGDPARILVELSSEVSMIVVGRSGVGGFADRLLGSVSSALASHAVCKVVVVPLVDKEEVLVTDGKIIVGIDGSQSSIPALQSAIYESKIRNVDLTAVMAVPTVSGIAAWFPAAIDKETILEDVSSDLDEIIDSELANLEDNEFEIERLVIDGHPVGVLSEFSSNNDLVIVGTRGRGGFTGLLLGSTSQSLLNNAKCPVMVVPSMITMPDIFKEKEK